MKPLLQTLRNAWKSKSCCECGATGALAQVTGGQCSAHVCLGCALQFDYATFLPSLQSGQSLQ